MLLEQTHIPHTQETNKKVKTFLTLYSCTSLLSVRDKGKDKNFIKCNIHAYAMWQQGNYHFKG